jgi:hypothetical protein
MQIIPRCPSVARLREIGVDYPEKFRARAKAGFEWTRYDGHKSHAVASFLAELNALSGHYGVESLYPERPELWFLDAGDSYAATVFYNSATDNLFISDFATASGAERR